jgi:hypothetical protein
MIPVSGEVIAEVSGVALKQLVQQLNFDEQYSILLVWRWLLYRLGCASARIPQLTTKPHQVFRLRFQPINLSQVEPGRVRFQ